ncbi:hypothetical protein HanIR_Chr16g0821531 [Helianthus annuus]|nr:hypothetical protein HanIR_Chr16g0821531 [Helianthus annuus]
MYNHQTVKTNHVNLKMDTRPTCLALGGYWLLSMHTLVLRYNMCDRRTQTNERIHQHSNVK